MPAEVTTTTKHRAGWISATILGVGLASLFADASHEMATAALPLLVASLGGASVTLGLIEGLSDGLSSFCKLISGAQSDRMGKRKPLAVAGYAVTALGMASLAGVGALWEIFAARMVAWVGRGTRGPIRNVLLTEAVTPETYGRAFGLERAMDSMGAVIGPLLALGLLGWVGLRPLFAWTLVPGALALFAFAFLVREKPHAPGPGRKLFSGFGRLSGSYRRFLLGVGLAGLGDFSNTLLILFATEAWTHRFGAARAALWAMLFYVGYNVVYAGTCYGAGALADRLPQRGVLAVGYALAVIPAAALLIPGASFLKFGFVFGVSGLYMGIWETVEKSSAAAYLSPEIRGTGFGLLATVNGVGDFLSSVLVGVLWAITPVAAMGFVALSSLAGAAVVATTPPPAPTA